LEKASDGSRIASRLKRTDGNLASVLTRRSLLIAVFGACLLPYRSYRSALAHFSLISGLCPNSSPGCADDRSGRELFFIFVARVIETSNAPHSPIPVRPRNAGCDTGPLMVGAGVGDASGAGIRFSGGTCGLGGAKRVNTLAWLP
jgi:hypothetical protein